jgi:hypothetical protein
MKDLVPLLLIIGGAAILGVGVMKTSRGIRNNNPGNLRISANAWQGKVPVEQNTDGAFEQFITPEHGIRALFIDLRSKINRGLDTVEKIMNVYAPPNENNTIAYITAIENMTGISRFKTVNVNDIPKLIPAIIKVENGVQPYTDAQLKAAYAMV